MFGVTIVCFALVHCSLGVLIFPGTKWCGVGDIAENENDLGIFRDTDSCCRAQDNCDDNIYSGQSNHGLTNKGMFTSLHCECEHAFYICLKRVNGPIATVVGTGYFDVLGGQCFDEQHPATCVKYESILGLRKRCSEYKFDETKPKLWQWFDVPRFTQL